jgi:hypothetical protein
LTAVDLYPTSARMTKSCVPSWADGHCVGVCQFFAFLFRNSVRAVDLFNLPPSSFLEIWRQIEI